MRKLTQDELQHYGVLGMKWGHRKYRDRNGNYTSAGKKRYISDKTKAIRKDIHDMKTYNSKARDSEEIINALEVVKNKQEAKYSKKWDKKVAKEQRRTTATGNLRKDGKTFSKLNKKRLKAELHDSKDKNIAYKQYKDFVSSARTTKGKDYVNQLIKINNKRNKSFQLKEYN